MKLISIFLMESAAPSWSDINCHTSIKDSKLSCQKGSYSHINISTLSWNVRYSVEAHIPHVPTILAQQALRITHVRREEILINCIFIKPKTVWMSHSALRFLTTVVVENKYKINTDKNALYYLALLNKIIALVFHPARVPVSLNRECHGTFDVTITVQSDHLAIFRRKLGTGFGSKRMDNCRFEHFSRRFQVWHNINPIKS